MSRQPRLEVPGFLYHVTNRGIERRKIVRNDDDRRTWFRLLDRVATRCQWRVFAYILLDNHFHLYFRLTQRNLSSGMHDLESGYASLFNTNHERQGVLFQSRYHAVIVEDESHSLELTRYLHLNPCRAGITSQPLEYAWSSYRYYLNPHGSPGWLDCGSVLSQFALRESAARLAYKRFVDAGVVEPVKNPLDEAIDGWILGSEQFADRCRKLLEDETSWRMRGVSLEDVIDVVSATFGVSREVVVRSGRHGNRARDAAILLSRDLLSKPLQDLADRFGGLSRSAITETARRARERLHTDKAFQRAVEEIRRKL
jgi:REP element-mobilizing transposase RayT